MSARQIAAIVLWLLAWFSAGLIPAAWFAARDGKRTLARQELITGLAGTAVFGIAGALLW